MAWTLTDSAELHENIRHNILHHMYIENVIHALAENLTAQELMDAERDYITHGDFDAIKHSRNLNRLRADVARLGEMWARECLADFALRDIRQTDNDGFDVHVCAYGCHTVPADRQ